MFKVLYLELQGTYSGRSNLVLWVATHQFSDKTDPICG